MKPNEMNLEEWKQAALNMAGCILAIQHYHGSGAFKAERDYWAKALEQAHSIGGDAPALTPGPLAPTVQELVHRCAQACAACGCVVTDSRQTTDGWIVSGEIVGQCERAVIAALGDPLFRELCTSGRDIAGIKRLKMRAAPPTPAAPSPPGEATR